MSKTHAATETEQTPRIETNDGINVLIINGKLSRETTARHIVKVLDAHDALLDALNTLMEKLRRDAIGMTATKEYVDARAAIKKGEA